METPTLLLARRFSLSLSSLTSFPLSHPSPPSWCSPSPESIGVKLVVCCRDHRRGATSVRDSQSFVREENCVIVCRREKERWKNSFVFGVEEEEERKREF
ncbi:unnamed protein product [Arabidopsis halleri]